MVLELQLHHQQHHAGKFKDGEKCQEFTSANFKLDYDLMPLKMLHMEQYIVLVFRSHKYWTFY